MKFDTISTPSFFAKEFREYRPPDIEPPRRNYTPQSFVSMITTSPCQARSNIKPAVVLDEQTLARGRANSLIKRTRKKQKMRPAEFKNE